MLVPEWGGLCTPQAHVGLSNDLSCEAGSLSCCRPTPTGIFNQRFEALFPCAGALGCMVCFICARMWGRGVLPTALPAPFSATLSPALWVYLCRMWGHRVCSCPVHPTLCQSQSRHGHESPLRPCARLRPSYRSG